MSEQYQSQIARICANADKVISDTREALRVRGMFNVPHGIGWGLGSEGEYIMNFQVKPAVEKQKLEYLKELREIND